MAEPMTPERLRSALVDISENAAELENYAIDLGTKLRKAEAERDRLAEQLARATDERLLRLAISDPGAFVKRKKFGEGDYESVPAWGARAVVVALREGRGAR